MSRFASALFFFIVLAVIVAGVWLAATGDAVAKSGSPAVTIDRPLAGASSDLIDVEIMPELKALEMADLDRSGDAPIRYKKDGDSVRYEIWFNDTQYVIMVAALTKVSDKKSELDVDVQLPDSPFTKDYGLLPSDIPLIATMLDGALTEYIAAKLEGRGTGRYDMDRLNARIEFATFFQRQAFEKRLEHAAEGAFATIFERYKDDWERHAHRGSSNYSDSDYRGYGEQARMRESQREASRPTSNAEPTTRLPTNY